MKLRNKHDVERDFAIVLKIEKDNNTYIVYHDFVTERLYSGKLKAKKLKALSTEELEYVNKVWERVWG